MEDHNKENQLDDSLVWEEVHMEHIVPVSYTHLDGARRDGAVYGGTKCAGSAGDESV